MTEATEMTTVSMIVGKIKFDHEHVKEECKMQSTV